MMQRTILTINVKKPVLDAPEQVWHANVMVKGEVRTIIEVNNFNKFIAAIRRAILEEIET